MSTSNKLSNISRRDLFKVAGRYGMSSTLLVAGSFGGAMSLANLATAAESTYERRFSKPAKHMLKFGAAGFNARNLLIERAGALEFARDLETRTDGEIRVEFIGDNQICGQTSCVEKTQQGIVDIYAASTQNSAGGAPYLNVLDYAYMFRNRADQYHFLYSPKSQALLRDPYEKNHGLKFLFSHAELRGIQLGLAWEDKPTVTSVEDLFGTKNRVTGTQLGRIAMKALNLNPVPVAWEETLDGLKQGLIDGAETWASAVAYANMSPVVSQFVHLNFFCATEHTAMSASIFDGMGGELQDAVMERLIGRKHTCRPRTRPRWSRQLGSLTHSCQTQSLPRTTCATHSCPTQRSRKPKKCARQSISHSCGKNGASGSTAGRVALTPIRKSTTKSAQSMRTRCLRMLSHAAGGRANIANRNERGADRTGYRSALFYRHIRPPYMMVA